ncbi:hypothetical protein ACFFX0_09070 [Citricoccus parietis]|uniref:Uncharacterized protein n=1 Tax=Citricoccus parietis TaxID=592307 RepID=A0ABV5FXB9_9MICC
MSGHLAAGAGTGVRWRRWPRPPAGRWPRRSDHWPGSPALRWASRIRWPSDD